MGSVSRLNNRRMRYACARLRAAQISYAVTFKYSILVNFNIDIRYFCKIDSQIELTSYRHIATSACCTLELCGVLIFLFNIEFLLE